MSRTAKNNGKYIRDIKHTIEKLQKYAILKFYSPIDFNSVQKNYYSMYQYEKRYIYPEDVDVLSHRTTCTEAVSMSG